MPCRTPGHRANVAHYASFGWHGHPAAFGHGKGSAGHRGGLGAEARPVQEHGPGTDGATRKKHAFLSFERRINPAALGYPLLAFISVHVQQQKLGQLAVDLAEIPEILEGYGLTGSADLLLRVVALDAEDLFRINGKILGCDGVERTDTALAMQEMIPYRMQPLLKKSAG